jgi:hypothetical protein
MGRRLSSAEHPRNHLRNRRRGPAGETEIGNGTGASVAATGRIGPIEIRLEIAEWPHLCWVGWEPRYWAP